MVPSVRVVRPKSTSAEFRREGVASAAATIGPLTPGCRVVGLTYGQFSVLEILRHVLSFTGPADVDVVTWRLGAKEARDVARLRDDVGSIRRVRLLLGTGLAAARAVTRLDDSGLADLSALHESMHATEDLETQQRLNQLPMQQI